MFPSALSSAAPSEYGTFAGPNACTTKTEFGATVLLVELSVAAIGGGGIVCGNASGREIGFPVLLNRLSCVCAEVVPLLTIVNIVFQPPPAARCGMEPTKLSPIKIMNVCVWQLDTPSVMTFPLNPFIRGYDNFLRFQSRF